MVSMRALTKVSYPEGGPQYDKWDYFEVPDGFIPEGWTFDPETLYNMVNNNGFWTKGWQEITAEMDVWIDSHPELQGSQTEVCVEMEVI